MTLRTLLRALVALLPTWPHPLNLHDEIDTLP